MSDRIQGVAPSFEIVYDRIKASIKNKHVTTSSIFVIVLSTMQIMEDFEGFTGEQKKNIVLTVVKRLVREIPDVSEGERLAMDFLIEKTVSRAIDYVVAGANGELEILNQIEAIVDKCCPNGCFGGR